METVTGIELFPGVRLTTVRTEKFKTGTISAVFLVPISRKTAAMNAVLPCVLRRGTARLPDPELIEAELDDLYGARVEPVIRKRGDVQMTGLTADFPDEVLIPGAKGILEGTVRLMGEMMLAPSTYGGRLRQDIVMTERQNLIDDIRAEVNDKRAYANLKLIETMFRGQPFGVNRFGSESAAEKIGVGTLTRHYRELLASSPIEFFYCGAADTGRVAMILKEAFVELPPREETDLPLITAAEPVKRDAKLVTERMDVTQGRLSMGYRVPGGTDLQSRAVLSVLNAMFGGAAMSKLFRNVRERLALCYYADSELDSYKRVMTVSAGIDFPRFGQATEEIAAQLDELRAGCFSDGELDAARRYVMAGIYSAMDDPAGLESLALDRRLLHHLAEPEELAALAADVTRDEVVEAARSAQLDTVYFLTGEDEDE